MYEEFVMYYNQLIEQTEEATKKEWSSPDAEEEYLFAIEKIEETQDLIATAKWCNTKDASFNTECDQFKDVAADYFIKLRRAMSANVDYVRSEDLEVAEIAVEKLKIAVDAKRKLDAELGKLESKIYITNNKK